MRTVQVLSKILTAAIVIATIPLLARAEDYPNRPITVVVGFSAGGPMDSIARIVTEGMRANLGQPFIIENVAGASGSIAVGRVARAAPDGYP
jgi:tripartite-type tricarboxylate transporter receptor subunit TctC